MATTSTLTRIIAVPEDTFGAFPLLTQLAAIAYVAQAGGTDERDADTCQYLANAEFRAVANRWGLSVALDMVREATYFLRYGRALAWIEGAA